MIDEGTIIITGKDEKTGVVSIEYATSHTQAVRTVWYRTRHNAGVYGTNLLSSILCNKTAFTFPKSLYSTKDAIATIVANNKNALIIDFFAGIGSFPISIAHVKNAKIYSVDINPEAFKYVNENIKLNKLIGEVIPIEGDINKVIDDLPLADRIIMNLPGTAKDFLDIAVNHIKEGGILNYYEFSSDYDSVIERVNEIASPRKTEILDIRKVKSQSPGVWHIGLSIKIE